MTTPELEALREKLIEAVEAIDEILIPAGPELNPPKKVRWGKVDPAEYGKPTTRLVTQQEALAHADQRIIEGYAPPLTYEVDVDPAEELKGIFDRLREDIDDER